MSAPDGGRMNRRLWGRAAMAAAIAVGLVSTGFVVGRSTMNAETLVVAAPSDAQMRALTGSRLFFGHQSVGSNLLDGLDSLTAESAGADPHVIETRDAVLRGGFLAHAHVGVNGDPQSKFDDFAAVLDGPLGDEIDVALLKLCYTDITAGTDVDAVFAEYEHLLEDLRERHPGVIFLYATVPLTTDRDVKATIGSWLGRGHGMGPDDNVARQAYNERVRERFAQTGRLFDIAAVEAALDQAPTLRDQGGSDYYVLHGALSADPGHLNELGARAAAAEFVRVVAANATGP